MFCVEQDEICRSCLDIEREVLQFQVLEEDSLESAEHLNIGDINRAHVDWAGTRSCVGTGVGFQFVVYPVAYDCF